MWNTEIPAILDDGCEWKIQTWSRMSDSDPWRIEEYWDKDFKSGKLTHHNPETGCFGHSNWSFFYDLDESPDFRWETNEDRSKITVWYKADSGRLWRHEWTRVSEKRFADLFE
jgi:hypothetical protein